jgi:hypothetical protein
MPYQLFSIQGIMNLTLTVEPKSRRFETHEAAMTFYTEGKYSELSRGSTEDHEEYKVLEVRDGRLFESNSTTPLRRNSGINAGDFVLMTMQNGDEQIFVDTSNGLHALTWKDRYE